MNFYCYIHSIIKYSDCCNVKRGCEKYIVGNLYKYDILSVHIYAKSILPIKMNRINHTYGYVRHTRYKGNMCKTNTVDRSLDYLEKYLTNIYNKFELMFENNSNIYYYGI